jgi:hypothetical protein
MLCNSFLHIFGLALCIMVKPICMVKFAILARRTRPREFKLLCWSLRKSNLQSVSHTLNNFGLALIQIKLQMIRGALAGLLAGCSGCIFSSYFLSALI